MARGKLLNENGKVQKICGDEGKNIRQGVAVKFMHKTRTKLTPTGTLGAAVTHSRPITFLVPSVPVPSAQTFACCNHRKSSGVIDYMGNTHTHTHTHTQTHTHTHEHVKVENVRRGKKYLVR